MVIYFAIVAIANVFIGVFLACFIWFPANMFFAGAVATGGGRTARKAVAAPSVGSTETPQNRQSTEKPDTSKLAVVEARGSEVKASDTSPEKARAGYAKTWSDFAQQLQAIKSRVNYCRSSPDVHLLQQAAEQLKACAQVWYEQLGKCISGEELDATTKALVDGMDLAAIEMFAAQCETSISNLEALDYSAPAADVLSALEREIEMLDSQQKNVESSKKRKLTPAQ